MNNLAQKLAQSSSTAGGMFDSIKMKGTGGQLFEMDATAMVVIVVPDELGYGFVRMFQTMAGLEHLDYRITRSLPEAMAELNLPG